MTSPNLVIDPEQLRQWVGRECITHDGLSPFPARALAAAFDRQDAPSVAHALPPAWHWLYFWETPDASRADDHVGRCGSRDRCRPWGVSPTTTMARAEFSQSRCP
jgi:hydroxyacyl-ACP dehydratase HTD2-like protein with hotdog domain